MRKIKSIRRDQFEIYQKLSYSIFRESMSVRKIETFLDNGSEIFVYEAMDPSEGLDGFIEVQMSESPVISKNSRLPIIKRVGVVQHRQSFGIGRKLVSHVVEAFPGRVDALVPFAGRDSIGFFIACGFHCFRFDPKDTLLRRDLTVDTATLERLESILGTKNQSGSRKRKGKD